MTANEESPGRGAAPAPTASADLPGPTTEAAPTSTSPSATFPIPVGTGATALARDATHLYFAWTENRTTEVVARTLLTGGPVERVAVHAVPYDVPKSLAVTATHVVFRSDRTLFAFDKRAGGTTTLAAATVGTNVGRVTAALEAPDAFYVSGADVFAATGASSVRTPLLDGLSTNERGSVDALVAGDGAVFAVTTGIDYSATPMEWGTVSRLDAAGGTPLRVKLADRHGPAVASVSQGKLVIVWGGAIDVFDAKTLGSPSTTPLESQPEIVALAATPRGLFFVQRQAPDPYGKLDGLMLTGATNALAATAPSVLSDGGAPRLGADIVTDDAHVFWVRRDPTHPSGDAPGVIERIAR